MTPLLTPPAKTEEVELAELQGILGIRNNNPMNLRLNKKNGWLGQVGSEGGFCRFSAMSFGFRAAFVTLQTYHDKHQCRTLRQYIIRWAPPGENNTLAYVHYVSRQAEVETDTPLPSPAERGELWRRIALAMTALECSPEATRCPQVREALEKGYGMFLNRQLLRKA